MDQLSVWVGTGLITAGVSAALLAGAGVAGADAGGADAGDSTSSTSASSDAPKHDTSPTTKPKPAADKPAKPDKPAKDEPGSVDGKDASTGAADEPESETQPESESKPESTGPVAEPGRPSKHATPAKDTPAAKPVTANSPAEAPAQKPVTGVDEVADTAVADVPAPAPTGPSVAPSSQLVAKNSVAQEVSASTSLVRASVSAAAVAPAVPSLLGVIQGVVAAVVVNVGSVALTALQAVEALVTGPPVLPPGSTVTVRNSWITLDTGQRVAANWYYPKVVDDTPPTQMILLNHGLFALGPMYSYTAANLAEETYSIVVTPTLPSNPFLGDSAWLGGTGMAKAIADLFVGPRTALTQSALDAGYATQYGLDPAAATLPQQFALAGHSLGGNLVAAAAGFLAADPGGAATDLVGVIMLDGVPTNTTMADALTKLAAYESTSGHYIPIREIGAPWNLFNATSNVNEALTQFRPEHYNGVVLTGGVHMDSMRGGNPLIQLAAYLVAGFPQPQNPPAVDALSVQWLKEWFGGDPYVGDGTVPGTTIPIGAAEGVVIGNPPAARLGRSVTFAPTAPTAIPAVRPSFAGLAA